MQSLGKPARSLGGHASLLLPANLGGPAGSVQGSGARVAVGPSAGSYPVYDYLPCPSLLFGGVVLESQGGSDQCQMADSLREVASKASTTKVELLS